MGFSLDFLLPTFIGKYKDNIINPLEEREKEIVDTYTFAWHVNGKRANNTFTSMNVQNNSLLFFVTCFKTPSSRYQLRETKGQKNINLLPKYLDKNNIPLH